MRITASEIAKMIDLSCVRTWSKRTDIEEMVNAAMTYGFGQVSVLQCYIPYTRQLLRGHEGIRVVGNVDRVTYDDVVRLGRRRPDRAAVGL